MQRWSEHRYFTGRIHIEEIARALQTASEWRCRDTVWIDDSRLDSGDVEAACVRKTASGWTGHRFHLGTNKEVFGADVYAVCCALCVLGRGQEGGRQYTILPDSKAGQGGQLRSETAFRGRNRRGLFQASI